MTAAAAPACTGEPISWLALERYALDELDGRAAARVRGHVDGCPACRAALGRITDDRRVLPALPALPAGTVSRPPWWRRWLWTGGVGLAVAAAAVLLVVVVRSPDGPDRPGRIARWKGGELVLTLVRDRGGAIGVVPGDDPAGVADVRPDDRWKVQVTCPPRAGAAWIDVAVYQAGEPTSFPLDAHRVACGNDVVLPGAFRITGGAATVCVAVGDAPVDRGGIVRHPTAGMACVFLRPAPGL